MFRERGRRRQRGDVESCRCAKFHDILMEGESRNQTSGVEQYRGKGGGGGENLIRRKGKLTGQDFFITRKASLTRGKSDCRKSLFDFEKENIKRTLGQNAALSTYWRSKGEESRNRSEGKRARDRGSGGKEETLPLNSSAAFPHGIGNVGRAEYIRESYRNYRAEGI